MSHSGSAQLTTVASVRQVRLRYGDVIALDGIDLDIPAGRMVGLIGPDGVIVSLSGAEYRLLAVLVEHPNRVLDRNQLMDLTLGREATPFDRSIDVQVSRLRRLLEEDPAKPRYIQTVWGVGYVFVPDETR